MVRPTNGADEGRDMISHSQFTRSDARKSGKKERIETQIHRRRTVKAFSPLAPEWERLDAGTSATVQPAQPE